MLPQNDVVLEKGYLEQPPDEPKPSLICQSAKWISSSILPFSPGRSSTRTVKLRRTAYLDGLRGFAALLVYILHHELWAHEAQNAESRLQGSFGYNKEYYFAAFHGIRTFFTGGHYAVGVFFVVSGYCLSTKALTLLHAGEHLQLTENVGSALFRRWFRLYPPVVATGLITVSLYYLFGIQTDFHPQGSIRAELWKFYCDFKNFSFFYGGSPEPWFSYHHHTWTIPAEMKGSIAVYASLIAFSRATKTARLWCEVGLIFYFMYIADGAHYAMFIAGMLLADLDILAAHSELPTWMTRFQRHSAWIFPMFLTISIYLGGVPSSSGDAGVLKDSPGWYLLSFLKPQAVFDQKWFYLFWAAVLLVASVPRLPWLKRFFETRFCQYLGRISYMFYLFHGPVLWVIGDRVYAATGWARESHALDLPQWTGVFPLPKFGPLGLEVSFLLPHLILLPMTLWLADIGTTLIDTPSIKFAKWLYEKTLGDVPANKGTLRPS